MAVLDGSPPGAPVTIEKSASVPATLHFEHNLVTRTFSLLALKALKSMIELMTPCESRLCRIDQTCPITQQRGRLLWQAPTLSSRCEECI